MTQKNETSDTLSFIAVGGLVTPDGYAICVLRNAKPCWYRTWMLGGILQNELDALRNGMGPTAPDESAGAVKAGAIRPGFDYCTEFRRITAAESAAP